MSCLQAKHDLQFLQQIIKQMKYLFLTLLVLTLFTKSFSQFYIRWDEEKLRNYLKSQNVGPISKKVGDDGLVTMSWANYKMKYTELVFFNKDADIIRVYSIYPDNNTIFNMLIKIYDEKFVKISSTLWKAYLYGMTYRIEARYSDNLQSYLFYVSEWDK
jgi:hypothetical protein